MRKRSRGNSFSNLYIMTEVKLLNNPSEEEKYVKVRKVSFQSNSTTCRNYKLVQTASLSACQVVWHINELEAKIEEWFKQFTELNQPKAYNLLSKEQKVTPLSDDKTDQGQGTSTELCIEGVKLIATEGDPLRALHQEARSILSQMNDLIERLDTDREEVENSVKKEKLQVSALKKKIDKLSLWWIKKLPEAVQKEHEICAQDLCELQWHIASKKCHISCTRNKITTTEMMNQIVEGDLNYFKKNSPLLKEKMRLEDKLAEQAEHEVNEVTETLTNVLQELKQTKQSLDNAMSDANFERAVMQGQLDNLSKQLEEREKELRATENILDNFFNQEINTKYKLKEDEVALTNLHQKVSDLKFDAENLESNIEDWKAKSAEAKSETKIQNAICSELRQAIKFTRSAGDSELLKKKEEYRRKLNELEDMLNQSKQLQSEIENLSEKIKQSQDMKDKDDKEIHDKQTSIQNNNEQRNHLREQLTQVARLHNKVKIKMEQTKVEIKMQEQRSKIHIENLKRKIREEIGVRIKLQAKVLLDNAELDEFQNNANMKSATVMKGIKQAEKIVAAAESKFKKISDEHEKLHADYVSISSTYNKLQKRHQFIKEHLGKRRDRLQAQLTDDSEKLIKVSTELDNSLRRIKFLEEKLQELQLLSAEMSKQLGETHGMVKKLKRRLETTEFKFMNAQSTIRNLEKEFAHTKKRQKIINEEYHKLMLQRNETLKAMKVKLINACNKNNFLAEKYRRLQNTFLIAKTLLLEIYEERICIEVTLEDYKQLSLLESWMQKAVVEHFKRRGLYNQSVLAKLLSVSQENAKKIITVQGELSSSIQQISAFLLTLADSPVGSENIRNKHCIHHCVNEDKKSQAVQVTV